MMSRRARYVGFALVTAGCLLGAVWYSWTVLRLQHSEDVQVNVSSDPEHLARIMRGPHVIFRSTALGSGYGRVGVAGLTAPDGARTVAQLDCDRVDVAGGTGVCLTADRGVFTRYFAKVFDSSFEVQHSLPLAGIPSRTRVAPDGSVAALTVFVSGHSYAGSDFSMSTTIVDTRNGKVIADLEQFAVTRDGKRFKAADFNFWGVTFTSNPDVFYATLNTAGVFYLLKGTVSQRSAIVVGEGVECPSLSPDDTRIAFKKRSLENGRLVWQLAIRVLETGEERVLMEEKRSVDDQVEWLDNSQILYALSDDELGIGRTSVWAIDVDGGAPRRWLRNGYSPSVQQQASLSR